MKLKHSPNGVQNFLDGVRIPKKIHQLCREDFYDLFLDVGVANPKFFEEFDRVRPQRSLVLSKEVFEVEAFPFVDDREAE